MTDDERSEIRKEVIKGVIAVAVALVTVVIYTVGQRSMSDPDYIETLKKRVKNATSSPGRHEWMDNEIKRFRREISEWEHGEMGR